MRFLIHIDSLLLSDLSPGSRDDHQTVAGPCSNGAMPARSSMARPKAAATPTSAKSHKRQLSNGTPSSATPGTRASKRIKASTENTPASATPKKSKYFEDPASDEDEDEEIESQGFEESGYEDEDMSASEPEPTESESEEDFDSEEDSRKRKKHKRPPASKGGDSKATVGSRDLWREGVKTGLGPGKQVFIEKPKPRGDGGVKYTADKIHPNTMLFLADLKANNDREWFKSTFLSLTWRD